MQTVQGTNFVIINSMTTGDIAIVCTVIIATIIIVATLLTMKKTN